MKTINAVDYEDIEYVLKIALLGREYNMIQYPLSVLTACFNDERFKGQQFVDRNGRNKLQYYSDRIFVEVVTLLMLWLLKSMLLGLIL